MTRLCSGREAFIFWVFSRLQWHAQAQFCYYPGIDAIADEAVQQFPCDPYAYTTLCCPVGWTCFSNSLCIVTDESAVGNEFAVGTASRGTCTNPLWNDIACGGFCLDEFDDGSLQSCGGGNWCCQSSLDAGSCDCESGEGTFSIPNGVPHTTIGVTALDSTSTVPASSRTSAASPMTSRSMASSSSSTSTSKGSTTPISITSKSVSSMASTSTNPLTTRSFSSLISPSSISHTSTATSSAAAVTSTHPAVPVTHTTGFKAGIATASVIVALALFAFLLWFFWWRRRDRDPEAGAMSEAESDIYRPEPTSAVPGPILRPNSDTYEFRGNDGLRLSPVDNRGNIRNSGWSGGHTGGFAGRATDESFRSVVEPYMMPYEGT